MTKPVLTGNKDFYKIIGYVTGWSDYDGCWFEDGKIPVGKRGLYWWRSELQAAINNLLLEARLEELSSLEQNRIAARHPAGGPVIVSEWVAASLVNNRIAELQRQLEEK